MRREDVTEIRTVEDVFEGRKNLDPYRRAPFSRNESVEEISDLLHHEGLALAWQRRSLAFGCASVRS